MNLQFIFATLIGDKMAGKSNRGKNRKGSQQSAGNSLEQTLPSDVPLNDSSSGSDANGIVTATDSTNMDSEVKDKQNASHQPQRKQGELYAIFRSFLFEQQNSLICKIIIAGFRSFIKCSLLLFSLLRIKI